MKLTANERYLLEVVCSLRGNAYDLWGRLNAIREGKESVRRAAPKAELKTLLDDLNANAFGAHLPHPNDPCFASELKHLLLSRHRQAAKKGRKVKNVYDLVRKTELPSAQRISDRIMRGQAKRP